jgi:signal transduction histidine kinase
LLQDVTDQLRTFAHAREVSLHYDGEARSEVLGDDIRLSQVFFNVILLTQR